MSMHAYRSFVYIGLPTAPDARQTSDVTVGWKVGYEHHEKCQTLAKVQALCMTSLITKWLINSMTQWSLKQHMLP